MKALACAVVIAGALSTPAAAAGFSGLLTGGYDNYRTSGTSADGYDVGGSALASFGGWNAQANAGYQEQSLSGFTVKDTGVQGDLFWRDPSIFSFGGSVRYDDLSSSIPGFSDHLTSYGAFGEFYVGPQFTLMASGGGTSGAFDGSYFAVGAKYYLSPHFSIQPLYEYEDLGALGHINSYGGQLEAFFSPRVPLGLTLGYAHSTSSGVDSDQIRVGLTWHFGEGRDLLQWDRTGPTRWNGALTL